MVVMRGMICKRVNTFDVIGGGSKEKRCCKAQQKVACRIMENSGCYSCKEDTVDEGSEKEEQMKGMLE